jgi:hypothetical protein
MKEYDEDESQKLLNFMEISKINDINLARKYLISANWDEEQAMNVYFSRKDKINFINENEKNINIPNINNIPQNKSSNNNSANNNDNNDGFFSRYIFSPLLTLFSSCYNHSDSDEEDDSKIFHFLPNKVKDFSKFTLYIKKYLGIIFFYDRNNFEFLKEFINKICRNTTIMDILKQKCLIFPILSTSSNGYKIQDIISNSNLTCPSLIFCYNKEKENIFGKNNIIEMIKEESMSIDIFYKTLTNLIMQIDEKNNINKNILQESNSYNILTDGEILQRQKKEMEELEKNAQKMEENIKIENNKKKEILENIEKTAEELKKKFEIEPDKDNPDCCTISFRFPDGDKRQDRRFLKNNKVKDLYDYVKSLGNEIYTEEGNGVFSLYQPFPPKKYENMENTLENEGLFPNAVIQIKEE